MAKEIMNWFVGAKWGKDDQTQRFIQEGIWVNGYEDKYHDMVKSIQVGDRIAIKSSYTQKHDLPFISNGNTASVMSIKAIGTVIENIDDGKTVKVDWAPLAEEKKWYFYTHRGTIWRVQSDQWHSKGLLDFTFKDVAQDYDRFRNEPFWKERFGDKPDKKSKFLWTEFYEEFATKLLEYKNNRPNLIKEMQSIAKHIDGLNHLNDKHQDGKKFPLEDICPFTVLGCFNRGITNDNRHQIASKLAEFLGVESEVPTGFDGIPVLNNQKSWFFSYSYDRKSDDIDRLWDIFEIAVQYSDGEGDQLLIDFQQAYDLATQVRNVGWNLTMGLYWLRPWTFIPLDSNSQTYITDKLNTTIGKNGPKDRCNSEDYYKVLKSIESRFREASYPVHSFPELSFEARRYQPPSTGGQSAATWKNKINELVRKFCIERQSAEFTRKEFQDQYVQHLEEAYPTNSNVSSTIDRNMQLLRDDDILEFVSAGSYKWLGYDDDLSSDDLTENIGLSQIFENYTIDDIIDDGCFLSKDEIKKSLDTLGRKKNLILQGPPGTGKTWLAKRLAYALIGEKSEQRVKAVQFHPNLSYEDFVRGWRPAGDGKLSLVDGPFLEMVYLAQNNPEHKHVIVIEEINRGNPAQIFGEILTLLEADKRTPTEALELSYGTEMNKRVYIPENLYVLGTMNIADRSLALVDLALRRRFAFIDLTPQLGKAWREWIIEKFKFSKEFVADIELRINKLNQAITDDPSLGSQFQIGHSYVTPIIGTVIDDHKKWFNEIIETEIYPLLLEYYFDSSARAKDLKNTLLEGW